ncbi:MAG: RnfABCDGE type electron transport complex subunit C [Erysipelotrichaceae bacterium]|nr:RnfABCDGE type electron transport complex subunit C [Erysipelotrichaceae bacterium]MCI9524096.1 RnfABCDGE type electron transport complex subunit C [Erysipelotrichaceae bacterium]
MSLLLGPMHHHIPGHKDLSEHGEILEVKAGKQVFIPLYASHSTKFDILVKEGDHVCVGTLLAKCSDRMVIPIYSSVSGTVTGISKIMHMTLKPVDHIVIENDGKMETKPPFHPLDYQKASREELIAFMKDAGMIGLGGAGFPTYMKYQGNQEVKKLIINAVECEPYITDDLKLVEQHFDLALTGILAMKKMAQAQEAVIAIKKSHSSHLQLVETAVANINGVSVVSVPDVYPMGWERVLVRQIMKKEYNRLPIEAGAIVNNVTTAYAFANALVNGMPFVKRTVTISGNAIKNPQNVSCPLGVPASELIEACGGYTYDDVKLIAGGPMMGKTIVNDKFVVDRHMNAITVLANRPYDSVACLRCGQCCDVCPAGLQPVRIAQAGKIKDKAMMEKLHALDCVECGLCTYICPSRLDVTENVRKAKRQLTLAKK